jgi:hypothetical protein
MAEKMIREVDVKWTRKADEDDVGRSSKSNKARFRGDVLGSGDSSNEEVFGKTSSTSLGDDNGGSSVRNLDAAGDLKRERGIGGDIQVLLRMHEISAPLDETQVSIKEDFHTLRQHLTTSTYIAPDVIALQDG